MERGGLETPAKQVQGRPATGAIAKPLELAASAILILGLVAFTVMFSLGLVSFIALVNSQENLVSLLNFFLLLSEILTGAMFLSWVGLRLGMYFYQRRS